MKTFLAVLVLLAAGAVAGYYGLPILIDQETASLKSDLRHLAERVQKVEEFIKKEEKARESLHLPPDADFYNVIESVNALSSRLVELEKSIEKMRQETDESLSQKMAHTEAVLKEKSETIDKIDQATRDTLQRLMFETSVATARAHTLKIKIDLVSKNVGSARSELELIEKALDKSKDSASDEDKSVIDELQGTLKKIRSEVDTDLPVALNRIDLLWHELSKLMRDS
jgi:predicted  nucleic acid-binding Zn-ribbon protein